MANSHCIWIGVSLNIAGQHAHRIGVVDKKCIGAYLQHVFCKVFQHRNGAQSAEDAADAQCITYGLLQTVFFWHFKVYNSTGVIAAYLNGIADKVCASQCILAVFYP